MFETGTSERTVPVRAAGLFMAVVLGVLLTLPMLLATAPPAQACRCLPVSVERQARGADLVVAGTVLEVRDPLRRKERRRASPRDQERRGGPRAQPGVPGEVTLIVGVDRTYQGELPKATIEISAPRQATACGLGADLLDERFIFFLGAQGSQLRTDSCGATLAASARARAIRTALGPGTPVGGESTPDAPPQLIRTLVAESTQPHPLLAAAPGGLLAGVGLVGLVLLGGLQSRP